MIEEQLSELSHKLSKSSFPLSTREKARNLAEGGLTLGELERQKLAGMIEILSHSELESLIDEGKITLGIIKASANQGRYEESLTDEEAAEKILKEIGAERVIFKASVKLNREQAEEFYLPVQDKYRDEINRSGTNVWNLIIDHACSGPLTFLLIYDGEGKAIEWWREKMGTTHPAQADSQSIRGKYALEENLPNNLVHGSDQKAEVKRELGVLKRALESFLH